MKIYFAGSIRGGRDDVEIYMQIINHLKKHGEVLTEHIGDKNLSHLAQEGPTDKYIHDRDMAWLDQSNVLVAEVSTPSLGVGYEIARALERKKNILCLFRPKEDKRLSAMISGSSEIKNIEYHDLNSAKNAIDEFFKSI